MSLQPFGRDFSFLGFYASRLVPRRFAPNPIVFFGLMDLGLVGRAFDRIPVTQGCACEVISELSGTCRGVRLFRVLRTTGMRLQCDFRAV